MNPKPLAVTGMILGICSIVFCWVPFLGLAAGIVGLVLSLIAKNKAKAANLGENWDGKAMATAGLICSIIGMAVSVIYLIFWIIALSAASAIIHAYGTTTTTW
jgi:hypothetical protein